MRHKRRQRDTGDPATKRDKSIRPATRPSDLRISGFRRVDQPHAERDDSRGALCFGDALSGRRVGVRPGRTGPQAGYSPSVALDGAAAASLAFEESWRGGERVRRYVPRGALEQVRQVAAALRAWIRTHVLTVGATMGVYCAGTR